MTPKDALLLLQREIKKFGIDVVPAIEKIPSAKYEKMKDTLTELSKLPDWGNSRDIKTLAKPTSLESSQQQHPMQLRCQ